MARQFFGVEKGLDIFQENGGLLARVLSGTAIPDGTSGGQDSAPIGSLYLRSGTGQLYQKIADADLASDWSLISSGGGSASIGNWRSESLLVVTNDSVDVGVPRDMVSAYFSDDNGTIVPIGDYAVGKYIVADVSGSKTLLQISDVSGNNVTFVLPTSVPPIPDPVLSAGDAFLVKHYLPDSPANQEGYAIVVFNGTSMIKLGDVNWNFADGIGLAISYSPVNGVLSAGDTVNSAIEKLDGNQLDLISLSGVLKGATELGSFTGTTIADGRSIKGALQDLETAHEATADDVSHLVTLSGAGIDADHFGSFTGSSLADDQTAKQLFQRIEDLLEQLRGVQSTGITGLTIVDAVPVASVKTCKWLIEAFEEATPANIKALELFAVNDGSTADHTVYARLALGADFNLTISLDVFGGNMRLRAESTTAGVTVTARRLEVVKSVL